jgi:hypothetical protein
MIRTDHAERRMISRQRYRSAPFDHTTLGELVACGAGARRWVYLVLACLAGMLGGCAAFHPLDGMSAQDMPFEYKMPQRSARRTIDLSLLRQPPPTTYRVDTGDVLGVFIEGVLGRHEQAPPVHFSADQAMAHSVGYPIPVRSDGTISLPMVAPIPVRSGRPRQNRPDYEERIRVLSQPV